MKIETVEYSVEEAYQILRNMCERPAKDECSLYAELLAKKLKALDDNKCEIIMHEISDLMFRAKMQNQNFRSIPSHIPVLQAVFTLLLIVLKLTLATAFLQVR
jgi:hypothetical protein